jgi:hypothetical protein
MEVIQNDDGIKIGQTQYVKRKLEEFNEFLKPNVQRTSPLDTNFQIQASESNETEKNFPYRPMVVSLMYAATGTRPDIAAAVGIVSRYLSNPKTIHCDMVRVWVNGFLVVEFPINTIKGVRQVIVSFVSMRSFQL